VLAAGVEERAASDNGLKSIAERGECIDRPMRLELGTQLHLPQLRLPFLATLGSAAPFISLSGTVWGIMRRFNAMAAAQNTSLSLVAAGHRRRSFRDRDGARRGNPAVVAYNKFTVEIGRFFGIMQGLSGRSSGRLSRIAKGA